MINDYGPFDHACETRFKTLEFFQKVHAIKGEGERALEIVLLLVPGSFWHNYD